MSYDYRIPQGRDKGKRTNGMFSLGGKLGSVLSALGNGEKLMQVRLWQNWEMVMGPDIAPLAWPLGARNDILIVGGEDNLALQELSFMTPEILERSMRLWMPRYSTGSNCGLSWATGLWIRCLTSNLPRGSARILPAPGSWALILRR